MKAPVLDHVRAESLPHALALLAEHGEGARLLAGGQSLVPALNLRLSAPGLLIDIGGLEELRGIAVERGVLRLGALVRHVELERSDLIARHAPLLASAARHIAHPAIRNRGTLGGSLANADPAAELPACALALGARLVLAGPGGERRVAADDFFLGLYSTALAPDEVLTAVEIDAAEGGRSAFGEYARRLGDYAMVGLAAHAARPGSLRLAWFGVGDRPVLTPATAAAALGGGDAVATLTGELAPNGDLNATAATRLQLARVLLRSALDELRPLDGSRLGVAA